MTNDALSIVTAVTDKIEGVRVSLSQEIQEVALETKGISVKMDRVVGIDGNGGELKDHNGRLTSLEKFRWQAAGIIAAVVFLLEAAHLYVDYVAKVKLHLP